MVIKNMYEDSKALMRTPHRVCEDGGHHNGDSLRVGFVSDLPYTNPRLYCERSQERSTLNIPYASNIVVVVDERKEDHASQLPTAHNALLD